MTTGKLTEYQRKVRHPGPFLGGQLPDYNFPKIKFCSKGHAVIGDNVRVETNRVRCRICNNLIHDKSSRSGNVGEPIIRRVFEGLRDGKTMAAITGRRGGRYIGGRIISNTRLDAFCNKNPKIGKVIRSLSAKNAIEQRAKCGSLIVTSPAIIRSSGNIMNEIALAVPRHLSPDHRDDVIQNIWMAVLERKLKRSEIASRAHEFIRSEYKSNHNAWGPRSLDVPILVSGNATLLDTLASGSSGLWD
jgi:hypothetical protein